ncbi:MAG: glycine cleavage system protein GcvH [Armatimonadetes bacterium]|nr:glycine cleavage system protein GcvH [Armatimonadota bacterium]MCA1996994.1 glycine cleavage system protein GcvH [Armatimonadota bacterium]
MNIPSELKYTKSHEWVRFENGVAVVGITDFAQSELGDVVYVELPEVGRALAEDEVFGTVESVKTVSELISPVPGKVVGVNPALANQPELVNSDPYGAGWMVKVEVSGEAQGLLSADEYAATIE